MWVLIIVATLALFFSVSLLVSHLYYITNNTTYLKDHFEKVYLQEFSFNYLEKISIWILEIHKVYVPVSEG